MHQQARLLSHTRAHAQMGTYTPVFKRIWMFFLINLLAWVHGSKGRTFLLGWQKNWKTFFCTSTFFKAVTSPTKCGQISITSTVGPSVTLATANSQGTVECFKCEANSNAWHLSEELPAQCSSVTTEWFYIILMASYLCKLSFGVVKSKYVKKRISAQ